ncbi:MAG: hypothetical protein HKP55_05670 [Gammaproteobacteria bacterium]|nr:hypothetical protein [Gammaproteobacteria bacterium]NNJ91143.1 hypothetical protein [Gammaproteobacteria bacterium]
MGLLDDVHNQADEKRQRLSDEEHLAYQQEKTYAEHINPRLIKVYVYFNELVNELNFLDEPVYCAYEIPGGGIQQDFYHGKYTIASDSSHRLTEIKISFLCQRDKPINFIIDNEITAAGIIDELHANKVGLAHKPNFDSRGQRKGTRLDLTGQIPVQIRLFIVPGSIEIKLQATNMPVLGIFEKSFKPHEIDEQFMEQLGLCLLRRENNLMTFNLPIEPSNTVRRQEQTENNPDKPQKYVFNPDAVQENKAPKPGFIKRLFSRH